MRIDKYLWCIRVYKTRSQATEACKGGKVLLNEQTAKPASLIKPGDEIASRFQSIYKRYKVVAIPPSRIAAARLSEFAVDHTDPAELEKLKQIRLNKSAFRDPGSGRPTKKDRRDIIRYFNED